VKKGTFGPAYYFPSIEAKYGRSIAEWKAMMRATGLDSYADLVAWLKREHGFGHGHANAITVDLLNEGKPRLNREERVARLFPPAKAHWRPVYDALEQAIMSFGDVRVLPKNDLVGFGARSQFALLHPSTPKRFDVVLKLPDVESTDRLEPARTADATMTHRVRITAADQVDAELIGWLRQAYEVSR
jgi:hypothetical protein